MILDKKSQPTVTNSGVNVFGVINRNGIIILSLVVGKVVLYKID